MEWIVEADSLSDFVDHGRYTIHTNIVDSGDCNRCGKKETCEFVPKPGQLVRYNCPFYKRAEGER